MSISTAILLLTGCKPKGDPVKTITTYYQNVIDGNAEGAYEQLSEVTKKNFPKEDFIKYLESNKEIATLKKFKVEKLNEYKNKDIEGTTFKNVVEFSVVEKLQDLYENKEVPLNYKRSVVNDNGVWKVYREKVNVKDDIANNYVQIAYMYAEGKGGKTKDLNQALIILNDALKYNKEYAQIYYALGYSYLGLYRYDEALIAMDEYMSKVTNEIDKSDGYNILGNIYLGKENIDKAKDSYKKALEINPSNQYAKTNLVQLE